MGGGRGPQAAAGTHPSYRGGGGGGDSICNHHLFVKKTWVPYNMGGSLTAAVIPSIEGGGGILCTACYM